MEKVFPILHEVDFLQEEVRLLLAETLLSEHLLGCLLQLVVGPLNLLDVDLLFLQISLDPNTYLIHFNEPLMNNLLLSWTHCTKTVEEGTSPHDLRNHDHLVYQSVSVSD